MAMSRARDKLHIPLLSTFLCACISFIVFGLIGERSIDAGQDKMSEVGVRQMNLIVESLAGRPVYTEFTVEPNLTWGSNGAFIVIYTDQECGVRLYEMVEFTEQISTDHELLTFAVNQMGTGFARIRFYFRRVERPSRFPPRILHRNAASANFLA